MATTIDKNKEKIEFDYSLGIRGFEYALEPESIFWEKIKHMKIVHGGKDGCHKLINVKLNETEITFQCACGTFILYPQREDRDNCHLGIFISRRDYNARKFQRNE